ncbi:FUSC family protein [Formicincola oecophyllae]|uniref:FUSC family protein n=1 Tax=Formicincola oecophyllae TaxID=2558361 RepID=A0A4Y6U9T2_9PROT|nr:FUSC family protein [Formicincola oecophyllae]QDH13121.1 FUSC family protein [Formicincola oecophyllae]
MANRQTSPPTGPEQPQAPLGGVKVPGRPPLPWWRLYRPALPPGFLFTLRTTVACLLALGLALPMELDSPAWAPLTAWVVAQDTSGRSLSKAYWRTLGTLAGLTAALTLAAIFPQGFWLFYLGLGGWVIVCVTLAGLEVSFRSYGWALAGFTCVIITMSAAPNAGNVFNIAVARTSYILLGIGCEMAVEAVFSGDPVLKAHKRLAAGLQRATTSVCSVLRQLAEGVDSPDSIGAATTLAEQEIARMLVFQEDLEFIAIELGPDGRAMAERAQLALGALAAALSHLLGASIIRNATPHDNAAHKAFLAELDAFTNRYEQTMHVWSAQPPPKAARAKNGLPASQAVAADLAPLLQKLDGLRGVSQGLAREAPLSAPEKLHLFTLAEVLDDLAIAAHEMAGPSLALPVPHPWCDRQLALLGGVRSALCIVVTGFIAEVTAWSEGMSFIAYATVVCCVYSPRANAEGAAMGWLKGTLCAAAMAWFLVTVMIPTIKTYEPLALVFGLALMTACKARATPSTMYAGIIYGFMLFLMSGLSNHHDMDELSYYNRALCMCLSATTAVLMFKLFFPFNLGKLAFRARRSLLHDLAGLWQEFRTQTGRGRAPLRQVNHPVCLRTGPHSYEWINHSLARFAQIATRGPVEGDPLVRKWLAGLLGTLSLGLNVIRCERFIHEGGFPQLLRQQFQSCLDLLMPRAAHFPSALPKAREGEIRERFETALSALDSNVRQFTATSQAPLLNQKLTEALFCLLLIAALEERYCDFLNPSQAMATEAPGPG